MADLAAQIEEAVKRDGLVEIIVRVSRYEADLKTPACWQAICKYRGRETGPWGVSIRARAAVALERALEAGARAEPEEDIFA